MRSVRTPLVDQSPRFSENHRYALLWQIGVGAQGHVYKGRSRHVCTDACVLPVARLLGLDTWTNRTVCVKTEPVHTTHPRLEYEAALYEELQHVLGVPRTFLYCNNMHGHNMLVMDALGSSLEDLFQQCGRYFSLKTILMLADQLLQRLQSLHSRGYVHRCVCVRVCMCA
jgi:serine/threonine protein kinase